jgi:hypothetical protein
MKKYSRLASGIFVAALAFTSGCLVVSTHKMDVSGDVNISGGVPVVLRPSSQPTQELRVATCCLTSGEYVRQGKLVPVAAFTSQDRVRLYVAVRWDDPTKGAGIHDINYNWYSGNKLISTFYRRADFVRSPAELHTTRTASDLGVGHFKAEIVIDKKVVGSKEFDISQ